MQFMFKKKQLYWNPFNLFEIYKQDDNQIWWNYYKECWHELPIKGMDKCKLNLREPNLERYIIEWWVISWQSKRRAFIVHIFHKVKLHY
jgi:hypothetical protein